MCEIKFYIKKIKVLFKNLLGLKHADILFNEGFQYRTVFKYYFFIHLFIFESVQFWRLSLMKHFDIKCYIRRNKTYQDWTVEGKPLACKNKRMILKQTLNLKIFEYLEI